MWIAGDDEEYNSNNDDSGGISDVRMWHDGVTSASSSSSSAAASASRKMLAVVVGANLKIWSIEKSKKDPGFPATLMRPGTSVTRLSVLLHFGQLFKASGNYYFAQSANIF